MGLREPPSIADALEDPRRPPPVLSPHEQVQISEVPPGGIRIDGVGQGGSFQDDELDILGLELGCKFQEAPLDGKWGEYRLTMSFKKSIHLFWQ
jgi:hypothetical protein